MKDNPSPKPPSPPLQLIRVFVSSPGDVDQERKELDEIVRRINLTDGQALGVRLEPWKWEENAAPQIGPPPQDAVDAQLPEYDVYLGIMSTRFGTPTEGYGSGTEQEFRDALAKWKEAGRPWILFYFDDQPSLSADPVQAMQYVKVCEFRQQLQPLGLVGSYSGVRGNEKAFFEQTELHLRQVLRMIVERDRSDDGGPPPDRPPIVSADYLDWLRKRCEDIDLLGMRLKEGRAICLDNVYVPLTTPRTDREPGQERDIEREREEKPSLLLEALNERSLYVSGDPGSGKSIFCRWVAWLACAAQMPDHEVQADEGYREAFPDSFRLRLPLLVPLREFWRHLPERSGSWELSSAELEKALAAWLAETNAIGLAWDETAAHLAHGTTLLILDGVDEVPLSRENEKETSSPRELLLAGLAAVLPDWTAQGNRVLITSRPYGLEEKHIRRLGLDHAPIEGLSESLQVLLATRWFALLAGDADEGRATTADLFGHIRQLEGVQPLAANPMLLTAICIIYKEGKRLPQDKYDLYDRIVDTVLYNRYRSDPNVTEVVRERLAAVALNMHTGQWIGEDRAAPQAEATYAQLNRILEVYREKTPETDSGVQDLVAAREELLSRTGLLLPRGDKRAAFYHLSFQEFLAADRLVELSRSDAQLLAIYRPHVTEPAWRNTLSFVFGSLVARISWKAGMTLLERLLQQIDIDRVRDSLGLAVAVNDALQILLGRGLQLRDELKDHFRRLALAAMEQDVELQPRFQLALSLGQLGDPRIVEDLREHEGDAYVEIPAGTYRYGESRKKIKIETSFRITRYPVTNSQFALFLEEGGYENQQWWSEEGWKWREQEKVTEPGYWQDPQWNGPNQPVVRVSFWEAEAFVAWAGGQLPTERQWEAAARGPDGLVYPWGDEWEEGFCNTWETELQQTSSVGLFPSGRSVMHALDDMAGNVREWCVDLWDPRESVGRVVRGGSWYDDRGDARCDFRDWRQPDLRNSGLGFRVLLNSPPGLA